MARLSGLPLLLLLALAIGCSSGSSSNGTASKEAAASTEKTGSETSQKSAEAQAQKPFVLGDLIEPFQPPTLEELNAKTKWIDQPVLDSLQLLRDYQKDQTPLATVPEALALKNTTPDDNTKILSALGRLPGNDSEVNWGASISRHELADVKSMNPIMFNSVVEAEVTGLTSFGLFGADWTFRPFAAKDAVVSWQSSDDRLMDKIVMRDDLTWSDGKPITAQDVVFSFKVIMSDRVPVPAVRNGTDKLRWVEAYGDHTLVFFHKEALATNVWNLSFPIIPKHIYEKSIAEDPTLQDSAYHVQQENQPVSGGSYELARRTRGKEIVLRARESWYMHNGKQVRDKPYFQEVRFNIIGDPTVALLALKKGEIEEYMLTPEQWMTQTTGDDFYEKNTKAYGTEWVEFSFGWNLKTVFFSDVRVRKAMSWAFNYDEMLNKLLYGLYEPSSGIFHKASRWYPKEPLQPYKQDLAKAEELLDEAGWTDHDGDGIRDKQLDGRTVRFEFSILCNNDPLRIAICTLLKENLDRIGIICNVRPLEFTVLTDKELKHDFQAFMGGWGAGSDPDSSENIWGTGQERNFGSYSNPEVDQLFKDGRKEFDPEKRAEIYRRIDQLIYADQPYTWLYNRNSFYGFNKQLRGYGFSPRGPYNYGPGFSSIWKPTAQP